RFDDARPGDKEQRAVANADVLDRELHERQINADERECKCSPPRGSGRDLRLHLLPPQEQLLFHLLLLLLAALSIGIRSRNERAKQRMRLQRLRLELRMELAAQEEGMVRHLNDLDIRAVGRGTGEPQAGAGEQRLILAVEFVAVAMAL